MCDTFVALGPGTTDGSVILGKNSDREPNEGHEIVYVPAAQTGGTLRCTYIEIPQVARTHAVILSKPYWIWGAEMGVNEHGVAIGNEAVFTKAKREQPGLLGMDLLRLGLERARTADEAVDVITTLLEQYGQGGQAGHTHKLVYDNSFIVSDRSEAWILETVGRQWAAQRVERRGSISNGLTLGAAQRCSPGLQGKAIREQSDFLYTRFSDSAARQCRTFDLLGTPLDVPGAFGILRDHDGRSPEQGLTGQTVCAHAGFGPIRVAQSTGSMVAHVADDITVWLTGTSAPCTSVFKPVHFGQELPAGPGRTYDDSMWWQHELLHRETLRNYPERTAAYAKRRDDLETQFLSGVADPFAEAAAAEAQWLQEIRRIPAARLPKLYDRAWRKWDRLAGMP